MFEHIHHVAYAISAMDEAIRLFRDTFELELTDRRVVEGERSYEIATFRCGPSVIELLRPIRHPELAQFLEEHGPGLHHVAFAVKDLPKRIDELNKKGAHLKEPGAFIAGPGWKIAYFDLENPDLALFHSQYHGDHLAQTDPESGAMTDPFVQGMGHD